MRKYSWPLPFATSARLKEPWCGGAVVPLDTVRLPWSSGGTWRRERDNFVASEAVLVSGWPGCSSSGSGVLQLRRCWAYWAQVGSAPELRRSWQVGQSTGGCNSCCPRTRLPRRMSRAQGVVCAILSLEVEDLPGNPKVSTHTVVQTPGSQPLAPRAPGLFVAPPKLRRGRCPAEARASRKRSRADAAPSLLCQAS